MLFGFDTGTGRRIMTHEFVIPRAWGLGVPNYSDTSSRRSKGRGLECLALVVCFCRSLLGNTGGSVGLLLIFYNIYNIIFIMRSTGYLPFHTQGRQTDQQTDRAVVGHPIIRHAAWNRAESCISYSDLCYILLKNSQKYVYR